MTREQVAKELTARIPQPADEKITITKRMLDDWGTSCRTGLRVPAFLIKPLCEITGDDALALAVILSHLHKYIAVGKWVMGSAWVLDTLSVKLAKRGQRLLRLSKTFRER